MVLFFQESVDHVNVVVLKTFIQYDTNCLMGLRNYCTQINISPFDNKRFFLFVVNDLQPFIKKFKNTFSDL